MRKKKKKKKTLTYTSQNELHFRIFAENIRLVVEHTLS